MQHVKHLILLVCVFISLSGVARADGGEQGLKPEERAFMQATYKAAMALMPEAPAGWTRKPVALVLPRSLGEGSNLRPVPMEVVCDYQKNMSEIRSGGESYAASMKDFAEKMGKVSEKMQAAIARGDQAEVARLQKEMEQVVQGNQGMQKMKARIGDQQANSARIQMMINKHGVTHAFVEELPAPPPAVHAIRLRSGTPAMSGTTSQGNTFLFFGTYEKKRFDDRLEIYAADWIPPSCKVHRVMLFIDASPEVADRFISRMDLRKVAGLINLRK